MKKLKKLINKIKKFPYKEKSKELFLIIKKFCFENKLYIFMFFSLFILDISTRIATNSIGFIKFFSYEANFFSFIWIFFIIFLTKYLKNIYGKLIYGLFYGFSLVMFLVHNIYYIYFKIFFDFSVLSAASEGSSYLVDTLKDIRLWMYIVIIISIILMVLTFKNFNNNKVSNFRSAILVAILFVVLHSVYPLTFGRATTKLEWNAWGNRRNVYNAFNDNNKSMELVGLFEYNFRNLYINYIREEDKSDEESLAFLENIFNTEESIHKNNYTGLFEGKNLN